MRGIFAVRWSIWPPLCAISLVFALSATAQTLQRSTLSGQGLDAVGQSLQGQRDAQALIGAPVSENVRRFHYTLNTAVPEIHEHTLSFATDKRVICPKNAGGQVVELGV